MKCLHCQGSTATKARGLCAACYWRPGLRSAYPLLAHKANHRGVAEYDPGVDPQPCGNLDRDEMLDLLIERAAGGVRLRHKRDGRLR